VAGELAGRSGSRETFPPGGAASIDDGAAILGRHAGQKSELADATFLGGLESSFHGKYSG